MLIRKIEDIEHVKDDGDIGVPAVSNFPWIDFVMKHPPTFFHMTTAAMHSGAENELDGTRQALGNPKINQKVVFVIRDLVHT